jgi:histidinol dehydrogenase
MRVFRFPSAADVERLARRDRARDPKIQRGALRIVRDVRRRGDLALEAWSRRLDGLAPPYDVTARELRNGWARTPADVRAAIRLAVRHIERVARQQVPRPRRVAVAPGVVVELRVRPIDRVGCYAPGGRYPLPSTVLMTVIPARVAGVRDVVVACPHPAPAVLCAALEAGATRVLRLGGAQAIAALAYGTAAIPRVDKIVGPGNAWVAAAKAIVSADCAIDLHAGPSEVVVLAADGRPSWIAADLIAQAEHDPDARAILVTTSASLAARVQAEVARRTGPTHPAAPALRRGGAIVIAPSRRAAIDIVNRLAPEHLVCGAADASQIGTAGTIFTGSWTVPALGDYCTGSNHVLPTGGAARFRGGLSAADFVRTFTIQRTTREGLQRLAPAATALARAEGLHAHATSIEVRQP